MFLYLLLLLHGTIVSPQLLPVQMTRDLLCSTHPTIHLKHEIIKDSDNDEDDEDDSNNDDGGNYDNKNEDIKG